MLLQEEYCRRHKLNVPEVHHTLSSGSLILRVDQRNSDLPSRWVVVNIIWRDSTQHPGHYEIRVLSPVHDGGNTPGKECFSHVRCYPPTLQLSYEEMEDFFREFAVCHGRVEAVQEGKESALTGWEIFLYCFDSYLAKGASAKLRAAIEDSIDFDVPMDERFVAYIEATNLLMTEQPVIFDKYEMLIHTYTKSGLRWLARLVNGG